MTKRTSSLFERLVDELRGAASGGLMHVFLAAEPAPESLRVSRATGRVYPGERYAAFYQACQQQLAGMKEAVTEALMGVALEFVCTKPRTGKLETPRGDVDNFAKGPLDAITKAAKVWKDDTQVAVLAVQKRYAAPDEPAGVHIHFGALA